VKLEFRLGGLALALGIFSAPAWAAPALVIPAASPDHVALHEINVDQGAAALFETPCGTIMIDAGGRNAQSDAHLVSYLSAYFAARPELHNKLAAIIITHQHPDHIRAIMSVANAYGVGGYIYNGHQPKGGPAAPPAKAMLKHVNETSPQISVRAIDDQVIGSGTSGYTDDVVDPVKCAGTPVQIRVLFGAHGEQPTGWSAEAYKNENNHSLAVRIDYGASSFLFLGDMEVEDQALLFDKYRGGSMLDVDVFQVAHHGSYNGTTDDTLKALTPKIAVIGVGDPTSHDMWTAYKYGHPRKQAIDALEAGVTDPRDQAVDEPVASSVGHFSSQHIDKAIYATAWDGDIVVTADAAGHYAVEHHRQ
jgi:beta-lactamase superfamily II metal-dependent hydrolase